jgi:hypothetical protein
MNMTKLLLAALLVTSAGFSGARLAREDERAAVERAVRDYVEALYQVKPELIERSVHPALEKMGLYRPADAAGYRTPGKMTYEQLHELAGLWNKDGKEGKDLAYDVQVLDVLDVTASAKLSAKWGIDYMHLVKTGAGWKIVQILWQSHPRA